MPDGADEVAAEERRLRREADVGRARRASSGPLDDDLRLDESFLNELDGLGGHADVRRALKENVAVDAELFEPAQRVAEALVDQLRRDEAHQLLQALQRPTRRH